MKNRITIKDARILANLTEDEACAAMNITSKQLAAWESGKSIPSCENAFALSETYGVSIDLISFIKDDNKPHYDNETLRKMILAKFESYEAFCSAVQMTPSILDSRLKGTTDFHWSEIAKIRDILNLSRCEVDACFFIPKPGKYTHLCRILSILTDEEADMMRQLLNARDRKPTALAQI